MSTETEMKNIVTHSIETDLSAVDKSYKLFKLDKAEFWVIDADMRYTLIGTSGDVYEGLEQIIIPRDTFGMMVKTCGWAAPLSADGSESGRPSEHRDRKRVRLHYLVTDNGTAQGILFKEKTRKLTTESMIVSFDEGQGALRDGIDSAWGARV